MENQTILIVEDDKNIAKLVKYNLEKSGYDCTLAANGEDALAALKRERIDLIVLDIMLPKIDGFQVCRIIKQDSKLKNIPIIMLTAKGEEADRVAGFELGIDDYLVKPFSPRELLLRIKAILRRGSPQEDEKNILSAGPLTVDIPRHRVTVVGREVELTPMEFKLLVTLMKREGRVQSRDGLLSDVWDINAEIYTRTVDTHIKRLREKLAGAGKLIETVVGLGYRFAQQDDEA